MIYSIDQISHRVAPIAKEHQLRSIYLFGSYARGEATEDSDIDLLVDAPEIRGLFQASGLRIAFADALSRNVDIIFQSDFADERTTGSNYWDQVNASFRDNVRKDMVLLYEQ